MKKLPFQLKLAGDWSDIELYANGGLAAIVKSINSSPSDHSAHNNFDLGQLTAIVEKFIGNGADGGYGADAGTWDAMDYEVVSFKDDTLKIRYEFAGYDRRHKREVKKSGEFTLLPGNLDEGKKHRDTVDLNEKRMASYLAAMPVIQQRRDVHQTLDEGLADGEFDFVHMKAKVYVKKGGRPDEPMVVTKIIDDQRVKVTDEMGNVVTVNIVDLAQWTKGK